MSRLSQFQFVAAPIFAVPTHGCALAVLIKPLLAVAYQNPFFAELDCCLAIAVQSVRRGVAAEQGSQRYPKLAI